MRRYLIIAAGVIVVIGIGAIVYFYFFASSAGVAVAPAGSLPTAGNTTPTNTNPSLAPGSAVPATPTKVSARLVRIDTGPIVAGAVAVDTGTTSPDVAVSYIERESGNVFSYREGAGTLTRTSNKTIPGIQEAVWLPDGSSAFVRYLSGADLSTINTYSLPANGQGGFFLPQNLAGVAANTTAILTLASGVNGSLGTVERPDGSGGKQTFSSPLSMLRASFAGKSYLAYTKPSATLAGYAYIVDASGNFSRVAGPLNGLTALASPAGNWVLVSWSESGVMKMELVNAKTRGTIPLPVATIADKCVWSADELAIYCGIPVNPSAQYAYPDDWYQGAIGFSDKIWKIDVAGRLAQLTLDFPTQTKGGALDATGLAIDAKGQYLVFLNKLDGALWSFQL